MSAIYVTQQGAVLRKVNKRLKVTLKREVLLDVPLIKVSQVVIFGKSMITAATIATLLEQQIEVCYLTQHGRFIGRIVPALSKNCLLRREQYRAAFDEQRTLRLAKRFVIGKLANMRIVLMRAVREQRLPNTCKQAVHRIKRAMQSAEKVSELDQVRGHEGDGSAAYFSVFQHLLRTEEFVFTTRERRPPTDPVNALLSFGYTLLTNEMFGAVNVVGFDPYIGYLHADKYGKPSLPLDLIEEFRPIFVDRLVLKCLNKQILTSAHFQEELGRVCKLTETGLKIFLAQYEDQKHAEFLHPILKQTVTYQQCFEQQARFLAKTVQGELQEYPPLIMK
jgi:CRISPR-associated protein Cas1